MGHERIQFRDAAIARLQVSSAWASARWVQVYEIPIPEAQANLRHVDTADERIGTLARCVGVDHGTMRRIAGRLVAKRAAAGAALCGSWSTSLLNRDAARFADRALGFVLAAWAWVALIHDPPFGMKDDPEAALVWEGDAEQAAAHGVQGAAEVWRAVVGYSVEQDVAAAHHAATVAADAWRALTG